jgi:hypothetical protein
MRALDTVLRAPDAKDTDEMEVILVRISDGQRRRCLPNWKDKYTWEDSYWWTEGNQSCPGNRRDEWAHQSDEDWPEHSCDNQEHYVILRSPGFEE